MPHIHEKIDFTAEVFIVYKNKVLLRKHDKYKIWLSVGGHVELDEDPVQAAIREAKEEVGLDIKIFDSRVFRHDLPDAKTLIAPEFMNRNRITETHEHVTLMYFATTDSENFTNEGLEASDGIHWFTKEELADDAFGIRPDIAFYAKTALEKLGHN